MRVRGTVRAIALAAVLGASAALLSGCVSAASATPDRPPVLAAPAVSEPAPQVTISPADGTKDVVPANPITVTASSGTLEGVTLTADGGTAIPGALSDDGRTWTATAPPAYKTTYHLAGSATGVGGSTPVTGAFTTVAPRRLVHPETNIGDGAVVGIAAPIEIRFDRSIPPANRAAVEQRLQVTTSTPVEGSWAWLPDADYGSRVHWRPVTYWPSGTTVSVRGHIYGTDMGGGAFGGSDINTTFTIGRAQIVQAFPASYGLESDPRRVTRSGTHIVMGKSEMVLMTNIPYGYENLPEYWAVRISNNGEFIHANPASVGAQGKYNMTHGCINLSTANGKAYFDTAIYGDPVEVTGSSIQMSAADGDVYDWMIAPDKWKSMSALS